MIAPYSVSLANPYSEVRILVSRAKFCRHDAGHQRQSRVYTRQSKTRDVLTKLEPSARSKTARQQSKQNSAHSDAQIPVTISGISKTAAPRFVADVVPILTRTGCNMGACHGAAQGKGNFRLSLLGYDPDADYLAIAKAINGRRVSVAQPDKSLLLLKPADGSDSQRRQKFREKLSGLSRSARLDRRRNAQTRSQRSRNYTIRNSAQNSNALHRQHTALPRCRPLLPMAHSAMSAIKLFFDSTDASVATVTPSKAMQKSPAKAKARLSFAIKGLVATARIVSP